MTTQTIVDIVEEIHRDLQSRPKDVEATDRVVKAVNAASAVRAGERSRLRVRPEVTFAVNTSQVRGSSLEISVRVQGVDCGCVRFKQERMFRPDQKNFGEHWNHKETELEWRDHRVAAFLKKCVDDAQANHRERESSIQEQLFRLMRGGGVRKTQLRGFQPVLFGGIPIQIPLPVTPRGTSDASGSHKGHTDILARSAQGRLVVFEVKRPAASSRECEDALSQAVKYAAALDYLMSCTS